MKRWIAYLTNETLNDICEPVVAGEYVDDVVQKMWITLQEGGAVGLAANQVGSRKRIILISTPALRQAILNPVITKKFAGLMKTREGCLSFPGQSFQMIRFRGVIVEGMDDNFKPIKLTLKNLEAVIAQHECDHLDGVTCASKAAKTR